MPIRVGSETASNVAGWYMRHEGSSVYNTEGLVISLESSVAHSYPCSGSTWYDISGNGHHATSTNTPTFISRFDAPRSINIYGDERLNFTLGDWTGSTHPTTAAALDTLIDGMTNVTTGYHEDEIAWGDGGQSIRWGGTVSGYPSYFDRTLTSGTATNYGWRVEGWIYLPEDGTYNFHSDGDDANNVTVDGEIVAEWYDGHGFYSQSPTSGTPAGGAGYSLTRDKGWYRFKAQFEEYTGGDGIAVGWRLPSTGGSGYVNIPKTNFSSYRPRGLRNILQFDGVNDQMVIPHSSDITTTGDMTVECWFNITSDQNNWVNVFGKITAGGADRDWGLYHHVGSDIFLFQRGHAVDSTVNAQQNSAGISLNRWYHLVGVCSGATLTLYVNGSSVATATASTATFETSTADATVGYDNTHGYHHGGIASCRYYNRALSATEVSDAYQQSKFKYTIQGW